MFTGIISDVGYLLHLEGGVENLRLVIGTAYDPASIEVGASIACNGICLTVVERGSYEQGQYFSVEASPHTQSVTTLGQWQIGQPINLERALKMGDELGGHLVTGHVDGLATVMSVRPSGASMAYVMDVPSALAPFIATKGSVTLDGVSLTVTDVKGTFFGITIIPHTLSATTWNLVQQGHVMNLEIDMLARYIKRMLDTRGMA
ncbi:MAG: riboflavin synthase [Rickettsiales bacterium]|nr:riboflavin synthase [Rickettsiales bacterium]